MTERWQLGVADGFHRDDRLPSLQWAETYRTLTSGESATTGLYSSAITPYIRAWHEAFDDRLCEQVTIVAGAQVGKALDIATPIPTPDGWKTMGDLKVGDLVFDEKGLPTAVTFATEVMYDHPCYLVRFSDGSEIVADEEHRWKVGYEAHLEGAEYEKRLGHHLYEGVITTGAMKKFHDAFKARRKGNRNLFWIPVAAPLQTVEKSLPIAPYTLGVWLGDGSSSDNSFCGNKHIPKEYLRASEAQRWALLQGIMDTDGTVAKNGHCDITLKSERLIDDVFELLVSLGLKPRKKSRVAICTQTGARVPVFRVTFTAYSDQPVFRLKRKQDRLFERNGDVRRRPHETANRRIMSIEPVESRPVRCITVASESHLYLAGKTMIPTHNTQFLGNILGVIIDQQPSNLLWVWPSLEDAKKFVRHRLKLLFQTPRLRGRFGSHGRTSATTRQEQIVFDGGSLNFVGSNNPSSLASLPCRYLICDEVDRINGETGEGSAIELAKARTRTFYDRKILLCSTPTNKGSSQIAEQYEMGTMERYCCPCPDCGTASEIRFKDLVYRLGDDGKVDADGVVWVCPECGVAHDEKSVRAILQRGDFVWIAEHPERREHRSFWLNSFVSPFISWREIVEAVEGAKNNPSRLRVKRNTLLGELWEGEDIDRGLSSSLMSSRQDYGLTANGCHADVPAGVEHLAVGIDSQDKYLAYCVYGYGQSTGLWCIERGNIGGIPSENETYDRLYSQVLSRRWMRADGTEMAIESACWDSGGHFTSAVYRHCYNHSHKRRKPRLTAIKGMGGEGVAELRPPRDVYISDSERKTVPLQILGVDSLKTRIMGMVASGQIGFSSSATAGQDERFFEELLSEKIVYEGGKAKWQKIFQRNETLDCTVYALGAFELAGVRIGDAPLPTPVIQEEPEPEPKPVVKPTPKVVRKPVRRSRNNGGFNPWRF